MDERTERHIGDILKDRNIEIVGADPATRYGFTQVPNFILTKKDISVGAKLAYAILLKYAWNNDACFPGQVKLADDMGVTDRSVRTYLKELDAAELLEIKQRAPSDKAGARTPDANNMPPPSVRLLFSPHATMRWSRALLSADKRAHGVSFSGLPAAVFTTLARV